MPPSPFPRHTNGMDDRTLSKRLSYLLRHAPHEAGLTLGVGGWVPLAPLLKNLRVTRGQLERVVAESDKQRFSLRITEQGEQIRANQGHSVPVDLSLEPQTPPETLYHGTHTKAVAEIIQHGLKRMNRHHVHLSADKATAQKVGARRGKAVIFVVDAARMHATGHLFYCSENGVWLVDRVPPEFLTRA